MATISWRTDRPVKQLLLEQYSRFDALQLLRLLQWPHPGSASTRLRFRADLSAGFAGHEFSGLRSYQVPAQGKSHGYEVIQIKTANYCVASLIGPMPEPFTEWVRDLKRIRSFAMCDFFDIFNHRFNSLRYQLQARQILGLNHLPPEQTEHASQLAAIMGLALPQLLGQIDLPKRSVLGLAGLLANCRKSAAAIGQVLSLYLGARVKVIQMIGAWQAIEVAQCCRLSSRPGPASQSLGQNTILGQQVWDQSARIRLQVAPLDYAHFCQLLPPNHAHNPHDRASTLFKGMLGLLRLLLNGLHDCEVQLQLQADQIAPARLLARPQAKHGNQLGNQGLRLSQTAWLHSSDPDALATVRQISYLIPAYGNEEFA